MIVKAVKSFSGVRFSMFAGEIREVESTDTVQKLVKIGYLEVQGGSRPQGAESTDADSGKASPANTPRRKKK